jgi:hypothetical protein
MRSKALLLWVPAVIVALMAVVEGQMHSSARAARNSELAACKARSFEVDVDGDGRPEQLRLVQANGDTWIDVWHNGALRSSTRLGAWHDDAEIDTIDVNGDGRTDLVRRWNEGAEARAQVWLSDGVAFEDGGSGVTAPTCVAQR